MSPLHPESARLDGGLVRDGRDALGDVVVEADGPGLAGGNRKALEVLGDALLLGLLGQSVVGLNALKEVLAGAGVADVLDADVDALLHVAVADLLVQNDADGGLGDVVNNAGLAVVDLVGHTLLDGTCESL